MNLACRPASAEKAASPRRAKGGRVAQGLEWRVVVVRIRQVCHAFPKVQRSRQRALDRTSILELHLVILQIDTRRIYHYASQCQASRRKRAGVRVAPGSLAQSPEASAGPTVACAGYVSVSAWQVGQSKLARMTLLEVGAGGCQRVAVGAEAITSRAWGWCWHRPTLRSLLARPSRYPRNGARRDSFWRRTRRTRTTYRKSSRRYRGCASSCPSCR
jgi:hypothetical protein